jgi:pSer/pThr/pTyr-binding forkhead associated (FHA) protein
LLIVRDLISTNGTKVNGQRVMWAALLPNDKLTLGRAKFKVYLGPDNELSPSELGRRGANAPDAAPAVRNGAAPLWAENGFPAPSSPQLGAAAGAAAVIGPSFEFEPILPEADGDEGLEILDEEEPMPEFELDID